MIIIIMIDEEGLMKRAGPTLREFLRPLNNAFAAMGPIFKMPGHGSR